MTKAELRRKLTPGTKLVLVNCLMGPCSMPRTVESVKSYGFEMRTKEGKLSHLRLEAGEAVNETSNGFEIRNKEGRLMVQYEWGERLAATA